ncbi:hypothetical protein BDA96_02G250500 [Sorghum bicolor]|uniref:F-box domain-containing protein n=2 Tax=Sorghum bicolor TaxID=4558 RepID=A0A921UTN7_SORBI|nr:F-box protein At3g07870-like isoform X2 [Sorghum bicolor]KAG0544152.1 hypothetical protein BDA96_02G250500 [Sorghum bicolor]KXG35859.1 hypothetical protein SORBI_3002G239400 [Sorghum bicolor]|eukprot:XP_021308736.1 F-box protein At3g07870-like isoform X2 [Sorghum bicolor]
MASEETKSKKKKEEECIINCLPGDLVERIFFRLSVSTLLRCTEVCKQWHKVIRDPQFITAHLEQAPRCALLFFPQESVQGKPYPSDAIVFDEGWSQSTVAVPVIGPDDFLCGSCNGLLCLYTKSSTIKIANLATGESLHLDKPIKNLKGDHFSFYRIGFHPVTEEYKVIHFLSAHQNDSQGTFNFIQVYTLGSDKWKDVRSSEDLSLSCVKNSGVVNVDGAMFWLTEDAKANWKHAVISFDLSEESFARIQLPDSTLGGYRRYWITEINGKVCIATAEVHQHRSRMVAGKLQLWTLCSKVESRWSQMYNLPYTHSYLPSPHFVHWDKIMMQSFLGDLCSYELFDDGCETKLSKRVKLLNFFPHKPDNVQCFICVKSLVRLDAYKKVGIVRGSKQQGGWGLKKWEAWERDICSVENMWKNVYELEQNSLVTPQLLVIAAKDLLQHVPDEVTRRRITMEIDQTLQHLPDCPDKHRRPQRRLNWVGWKRDKEKLTARVNRVKDVTKASRQAADDIKSTLIDMLNHLQVDDGIHRLLSDFLNHLQHISSTLNSAANISNES